MEKENVWNIVLLTTLVGVIVVLAISLFLYYLRRNARNMERIIQAETFHQSAEIFCDNLGRDFSEKVILLALNKMLKLVETTGEIRDFFDCSFLFCRFGVLEKLETLLMVVNNVSDPAVSDDDIEILRYTLVISSCTRNGAFQRELIEKIRNKSLTLKDCPEMTADLLTGNLDLPSWLAVVKERLEDNKKIQVFWGLVSKVAEEIIKRKYGLQ